MGRASQALLDESLPHGTREGYMAGCQGSHCPGVDRLGMSCRQASIRYASDLSYRRRIDGGLSPEAIWAEDQLEAEANIPTVGGPATIGESSETVSFEDSQLPVAGLLAGLAAPDEGLVESIADEMVRRAGRPPAPHGTNQRWRKGCRENCPGGEGGVTCAEAHAATLKAQPRVPTEVIPSAGPEVADAREALACARTTVGELTAEVEQLRSDFESQEQQVREMARQHGDVVADYRRRNEMLMRELEAQDVARLGQDLATVVPKQAQVSVRPLRATSLKVMPLGGGAVVEYDGAGRVELDFADGELRRATVTA